MPAVVGTIGELRGHALAYAAAGLEVFPLWADKTPRTANGMKDATANTTTVAAWWDAWPDALIGCRVPPDVVILDIDPKHNGRATWKALVDAHGRPATTRAHRSGRGDGGGHLWFRRPAGPLSVRGLNRWAKERGVGQAVGKHSWTAGIDLLHHGHRYTILPPSPHPVSGKPYQWVHGLDVVPAVMPAWLAGLLTEPPPPPPPPARPMSNAEFDSIADWFSAATSWIDLLVPEGWVLVGGTGDSDGSRWRHPNATAPHSATVRNGCLFVYSTSTDFEPTGEGDPHGYTPFRAYAVLAHGGDLRAAARAARWMKDGYGGGGARDDWSWVTLTSGCGPAVADDEAEAAAEDGLVPICWPDFWKRVHADEDWLVEPVLPRGRQVALWAVHKTGKSLLTLEMAAALATGRPCFGHGDGEILDVVYLDMEMTEDDLYDRLTDLGYGPDVDLDRLHYYLLPALPPLDTPAGAAVLLDVVARHEAAVVVIDTMARVVAGEENSADTYRAFYRHTGIHLKARGVSLLRLDHGGKDAAQGQRGSSAKGDDVDVVWQLRPTDAGVALDRKAARMSWVPETVTLSRFEDPFLRHEITRQVAWLPGTTDLARVLDELGAPVRIGRPTARRLLADAGVPARNDVLADALKFRKQMSRDPSDLV